MFSCEKGVGEPSDQGNRIQISTNDFSLPEGTAVNEKAVGILFEADAGRFYPNTCSIFFLDLE